MKNSLPCALALAALTGACPLHAFLGVADTSFVTVIANPAEAADWASELDNLSSQLAAARATLDTASAMRAYAGDPRAALGAMPDLAELSGAVNALSSGAQTEAAIAQEWQEEGSAQRTLGAAALLQKTGPGATMEVFGLAQPRDPTLYLGFAREAQSTDSIRSQISDEQTARASVASELALAWTAFRAATTESSKQAALTEISQLQSQNQVMDTRRNALVDDLGLAERQEGTNGGVRAKATDEQLLAESALLNATAEGRARDAQAQRMSTVQKAAPAATPADYSGVRLWTTADSGGQAD